MEYIVRIGRIDDRAVLLRSDGVIDIARASGGRFGNDPMAPFRSWPAFLDWAASVEHADDPLAGRALQNPIPQPTQVFAVGANYRAHLLEAGASEENMPTEPLIFTKFPSCLVGPTDPIPIPNGTIDWEVELVVVIGVRAEHVRAEDAWGHVAGLTVGQDISDRTLQFVGLAPQFSMSKSYPGFGPMGPSMVTIEEFADPDDLELGCTMDGELVQQSRTSDLIFPVPELIARLSAVCPLLPGDLIFTGTPAGVGAFRKPPIFLQPGQELTSWIEGIGELRNPTVEAPVHALAGGTP
jgi:2-keto-4-pentenoate hydratase/2-oxohepta-3-ene-1,7-dioic acid hydratase in catechol pathway